MEAVVLLFVLSAGAAASVGVAFALALRSLARHNRLAPRIRTGAPLRWLWSTRAAARMHRRLRAVVRNAHDCCPRATRRHPRSTVHELVDELVELAVAADRRLVLASTMPRMRRTAALAEAAAEIREIEQLGSRVRNYAGIGSPTTSSVATLQERLDALEAARREIDGIDWTRAS